MALFSVPCFCRRPIRYSVPTLSGPLSAPIVVEPFFSRNAPVERSTIAPTVVPAFENITIRASLEGKAVLTFR